MDVFGIATKEERDKIIDLVAELPSHFFCGVSGWTDTVKELHAIVIKLEQQQEGETNENN